MEVSSSERALPPGAVIHGHYQTPTVVVGVPQRPRLVRVKVRVSSYPRPWKVGVRQKAALAVKGGAVAVKARCEDDGDVHVGLGPLQLAVRHSLEAQRRHVLPHVERPPYGIVGLLGADFGRDVLYAARETKVLGRALTLTLHIIHPETSAADSASLLNDILQLSFIGLLSVSCC